MLVVLRGEVGEGELAGVGLDVHAGEVVVELVPAGDVDAEVQDLTEREEGGREGEQQEQAACEGAVHRGEVGRLRDSSTACRCDRGGRRKIWNSGNQEPRRR